VSFAGKDKVEKGRRDLPPCHEPEAKAHGEHDGGHHGPANPPCWTLVTNPHVCPKAAAAMVYYGDHEVRGNTVEIAASCEPVPAPVAAAAVDPFADPVATTVLGQPTIAPLSRPTKHELDMERLKGPPPEHTNMFFSIYFAMTGLHGIHVIAGILVYIWLLVRAIKGHFTPEYFGPVDYAALYWHLVDLIWIFLFPLLYLIH
jgi:hypothetical protein